MPRARRSDSLRLFIVLSPFREVIPELHVLLRPLAQLAPRMCRAEGYASAAADAALLQLELPAGAVERLGEERLLGALAWAGLRAILPERLPPDERDAFYQYLASYDSYVQLHGGGPELLGDLVDALAASMAPRRRATTFSELDTAPTGVRHRPPSRPATYL
jgi:hypothetical protein